MSPEAKAQWHNGTEVKAGPRPFFGLTPDEEARIGKRFSVSITGHLRRQGATVSETGT